MNTAEKELGKIAIVTCCTADWLPLAGVTLISSFHNTQLDARYIIITDSSTNNSQLQIVSRIKNEYGLDIEIRKLDEKLLEGVRFGNTHHSVVFRLIIDSLVPYCYDRVLYFDSDVLVLRSIDELLEYDLGGLSLAAVEDLGINPKISRRRRNFVNEGINFDDAEPYFNAGVILFEWKKVLSDNILHNAKEILKTRNFRFGDQDALNLILKGRWQPLPLRYNVSVGVEYFRAPVIRHFTKNKKPWTAAWNPQDWEHRKYYRNVLKTLDHEQIVSGSEAMDYLTWLGRKSRMKIRNFKTRDRRRRTADFFHERLCRDGLE